MTNYIVHLTPSLRNNKNVLSDNLGDIIIYESVQKVLYELFPKTEIIKLSTHDFLDAEHIKKVQQSQYTFIGGSNLLSSNINIYNQWKYSSSRWDYFFPNIKNLQLIGVGWWQYQDTPTWKTSHFYKNVLSKRNRLSVRDSFTKEQLNKCGINNVINTSCPTTWSLNNVKSNKIENADACIFSLTDYNPNAFSDNKFISLLLSSYKQLYFFPQGLEDLEYINSLSNYNKNKTKITILDRNIESLRSFLKKNNQDINYIGTRLHLGIFCLQNFIPSLIISIDNRASEISKDINLPVVERGEILKIKEWVENNSPQSNIQLPLNSISEWKEQFKNTF